MVGQLFVSVPSQRKAEGHVRYKIVVRNENNDSQLGECERRRSEIEHGLRDPVRSALGKGVYEHLFREAHFPNQLTFHIAEKLEAWLRTLFNAMHSNQAQFLATQSTIADFLALPRDTFSPRPAATGAFVAPPPFPVAPPSNAAAAVEKAPSQQSSVRTPQPAKMTRRLLAPTTSRIPFAKLRFSAYGRAQFAAHAVLYLVTAASIYEATDDADGVGASTNNLVPIACLVLGLVNSNACLSEARSGVVIQMLSILAILGNLALAFCTFEARCCNVAPPLPLPLSLTFETLFLLINLLTLSMRSTDCSFDGLAKIEWDPEHLAFAVHGLVFALPILVANLGTGDVSPGGLLFRHVLLATVVCNVTHLGGTRLSLAVSHLLHGFPFLVRALFRWEWFRWPFPTVVSLAHFVGSAAFWRFRRSSDGAKAAPPLSKTHAMLRSGSPFGRVAYAISAAVLLTALMIGTPPSAEQTHDDDGSARGERMTPRGDMRDETIVASSAALAAARDGGMSPPVAFAVLFLAYCNVHAALSSERSHSALALASCVAMLVNPSVWAQQLVALTVPTVAVPLPSLTVALDTAAAAGGMRPLTAALGGWQLSMTSLLLLKLEVRFQHPYELLLRGSHLVNVLVVILPALSSRAGFDDDGESERGSAASNERWLAGDATILLWYNAALAAFLFGCAIERATSLGSATICTVVLGGFFRVSVPGVGLVLSEPVGWPLALRPSIGLWLASLFFLRFRYLLEPRVKSKDL